MVAGAYILDMLKLRARVESWAVFALMAFAASRVTSPPPALGGPAASAAVESQIIAATRLFLADHLAEALEALDDQTLAQSGKANLLAGLIHLYQPDVDRDAAQAASGASWRVRHWAWVCNSRKSRIRRRLFRMPR